MQTSSRRAILATAAAALAGGCVPPALASAGPSPDAELLRLGAEFDRVIAKYDAHRALYLATAMGTPEADELARQSDEAANLPEEAADRIMAVPPDTMAGLALWAHVMLWRYDPALRGIVAKPSPEMAEYGVNEAYALAAAIERMASVSTGQPS